MEHESESSSVEKTTTLAKKRRAHYKSRKGCKECKQRHVKCDEQRPICLQCSTLERPCSYAYLNPDHQTTSDGASPMSVPAGSPPQLHFPSSPQESATQQQPLQVFNLGHLALLHHVETDMLKPPHTPFVADEKDARPLLDMILKAAFSTPFFMDELLAFAALHLGMLDSDIVKKDHYHHQAVHLQTRALAIFNATNCDITEQNCTAYFLFSSFIGMHMLYDTVTNQTNSPELLEGFIQFVGLYRGVGIVSSRSWHVIRNSELNSIFSLIEAVERLNVPSEDCCDRLLNLLLSAEERLGSSSYEACYDAVQILQWIFNQYAVLPEPTNGHIILAWPVRLPIKYLELLQSRQPEALVIMAYWAVLLHRGRNYWVFGQGGWLLIEAIFGFLGPSWDEWLAWPRQSLMLTR
ncbi:hypothetical protein F4781DRAFT_445573 [Annulohypoxylon bovei var. microspora]|nr:hypothetical protein F4781DRAFT_445573 [Annulohypoxylon bovei var. microspora]